MSITNRRAENIKYLKNANVQKALGMISRSEGTNGNYNLAVYGKVIKSSYFPELVGQTGTKNNPVNLPNLNHYPNILVQVGSSLQSSAVGRYQIIRKTYEGAAAALGITDFSETSQDLIAVELIRQRGNALDYILKGDIEGALKNTNLPKEWASLAGAGYGQGENSINSLVSWFNANLYNTNRQFTKDANDTLTTLIPIILVGAIIYILA